MQNKTENVHKPYFNGMQNLDSNSYFFDINNDKPLVHFGMGD